MNFNYSPEDEAFRNEFRAWLGSNREYAVPVRDSFGVEGAASLDVLKRWHRNLHEGS